MVSLSALLGIVFIGMWLYALIDAITTDKSAMRNLPKVAWIVLILLVFPFGAMGWLIWGRPARPHDRSTVVPRVSAPPTPEIDDAEVLLHIAERDRLLAQWAEEARGADRPAASGSPAEPPSAPGETR